MQGPPQGSSKQVRAYLSRIRGRRPRIPFDADALEHRARKAMSRRGYAYVAGGAGGESTLRSNRAAFERWRIVPRVLRDVSQRDLSTELFGHTLPAPLLLAPVGVLEMADHNADLALARATATIGVPAVFSNQASRPIEECAPLTGGTPFLFQLYFSKSEDLVRSLVSRAERAGARAIVVTLDTTMLGWRVRDLDLAYLPFLYGKGLGQYMHDPVFNDMVRRPPSNDRAPAGGRARPHLLGALAVLASAARAYPGSTVANLFSPYPRRAVEEFVRVYTRESLSWHDIDFLRSVTKLPIVLKGVLHPDDARRALDHGAAALIVSNHGGRQVDGAIAALDALPPVVEAVAERIPVLFDSGIRSGADVFKAVALGARAVCIGRPYVYGLAIAGEEGIVEVVENLKEELELTMALSGRRNLSEIGPDAVVPVPGR